MEEQSEGYKVRGDQLWFRFNVSARILFEHMAGKKSLDPDDKEKPSLTEVMQMTYCGTISGMKSKGLPFDKGFEEFCDYVDMDMDGINQMYERMAPPPEDDDQGDKKKGIKGRLLKL